MHSLTRLLTRRSLSLFDASIAHPPQLARQVPPLNVPSGLFERWRHTRRRDGPGQDHRVPRRCVAARDPPRAQRGFARRVPHDAHRRPQPAGGGAVDRCGSARWRAGDGHRHLQDLDKDPAVDPGERAACTALCGLQHQRPFERLQGCSLFLPRSRRGGGWEQLHVQAVAARAALERRRSIPLL